MIDFESIYATLSNELAGNQKRIPVESALSVYFGLSPDGLLRLSFMSQSQAPRLESTKTLRISQGAESNSVYWTCFDLIQNDSKKVYFTFLAQLSSTVEGKLVIIRVEPMANEFDNGEASIGALFTDILSTISSEDTEMLFISKISTFGLIVRTRVLIRSLMSNQ